MSDITQQDADRASVRTSTVAREVTVRNDVPRRDTEGNIVDAHEPCLACRQGRFWFYGTYYEHHNGFTPDNLISCYSSEDLDTWEFHGTLFPKFDKGLTVAPDVQYNPRTGKYVMWFISGGSYVVATADGPAGPFEIVTRYADVHWSDYGNGDFSLLVDDDGAAYIAYTVTIDRKTPGNAHRIYIERLNDDWLGGTGQISPCLGFNCEAPAMLKRDGIYYALFDTTCCYCPAGTGIQVHTAPSPLGPFAYRGNSNRSEGADPAHVDSPSTRPGSGRADCIVPAQQRRIVPVRTPQGREFIWIGDLWESNEDGIKGHDATYWQLLEFDEEGMIQPLSWTDRWSATIRVPAER